MESKFFGEFLVQKGVIGEEDLQVYLRHQKEINNKIGEFCLKRGVLRPEEVERILEVQKGIDAPFGEIALELNLLKKEEMHDLLFFQEIENLHLGEVLVKKGILSLQETSLLLREFSKVEKERKKLLYQVVQNNGNKELVVLIEVLEKYFLRRRHGVLKPVAIDIKRFPFTAQDLCLRLLFGRDKGYYLWLGTQEKGLRAPFWDAEDFIYNYLRQRGKEVGLEKPLGEVERELLSLRHNILFSSSTEEFAGIFY